jgi:two-component system NtrC family response regulator
MKGNILIIDDEEKLSSLLSRIIGLEGYVVFEAPTAKDGLKKLSKEEINVVVTDVKLPDGNGVELAQKIKLQYPYIEVIVLTAYGTIPDGVKAIKNGAFDYMVKGDDNDKILPLLARAMDKALLQKRILGLEKQIEKKHSFDTIIGESKQIRSAVELAKKVAQTDTTVLLLGETGTGKEVFARAIHSASPRILKPFVAINCSSFNAALLENELFGHKAGAYTDAAKDTRGLFEEASGGTLLLDEIGEMGIDLQSKLLRVLETNEFMKVGDSKSTKVDVRVIAATNRDLLKEAEKGRFRQDLYYRLAVFQVSLPALRDRPRDILPLAEFFLRQSSAKMNKPVPKMSDEFVEKLKAYSWKGNIRELKNTMERIAILSDNIVLNTEDLPYEITSNSTGKVFASSFNLATAEKEHILKTLAHTKGNKTEAARLMGIGLTTLYRKLEEYKIQ